MSQPPLTDHVTRWPLNPGSLFSVCLPLCVSFLWSSWDTVCNGIVFFCLFFLTASLLDFKFIGKPFRVHLWIVCQRRIQWIGIERIDVILFCLFFLSTRHQAIASLRQKCSNMLQWRDKLVATEWLCSATLPTRFLKLNWAGGVWRLCLPSVYVSCCESDAVGLAPQQMWSEKKLLTPKQLFAVISWLDDCIIVCASWGGRDLG